MKSTVVVTLEMDDVVKSSSELTDAVKNKLELQKNSVGILYCDSEMDISVLSETLHAQLGIDILGCTALASLDNVHGYHEMAATLTVLTADDCEFSTVMSNPLTIGCASQNTIAAYTAARNNLQQDPKLIFAIPPTNTTIILNQYLDDLSQVSSEIPIIGGLPSSVDETAEKLVFLNGQVSSTSIVLLLIAGNISPIFTMRNVVSRFAEKTQTITKASGTEIHEVDGAPFYDYIKNFGLDFNQLLDVENRVFFQSNPLLIQDSENQVPYVRILMGVDAQTGIGTCFASVPQGGKVSVGALRREDIKQSVEEGVQTLLKEIEESDNPNSYSTVLCITCSARHLVMNPMVDLESSIIQNALPSNLNLSGFYSYGELCPTSYINEKAQNCAHNASIVFCAF